MLSRILNFTISRKTLGTIVFGIIFMLMSIAIVKILSELAFADDRLPPQSMSYYLVQLLSIRS